MHKLNHIEVGKIGEHAARKTYRNKGFRILRSNYLRSWGEIDIIVEKRHIKRRKLHFIEVKSIQCTEWPDKLTDTYNPADNLHKKKLQRLERTITTFLAEENRVEYDWQLDLVIVYVNTNLKCSRVLILEAVG